MLTWLIEFIFNSWVYNYLSCTIITFFAEMTILKALAYSFKFVMSIILLILLRAGIPRYRYDYLTKLGWSKFILYCLGLLTYAYLIFGVL